MPYYFYRCSIYALEVSIFMIDVKSKEHLLDAVLEYCKDIVTVKDLNLNYVAYNKAFLGLVGEDKKGLIVGNSIENLLPPDCVDIIVDKSLKAITSFESQTFIFKFVSFGIRKVIKQTITPIIKNGIVEGVLTVSFDVTKEDNLRTRLLEKNYQLNTLLDNLPVLVYMKDEYRNLIIAAERVKKFVYDGIDCFADDIKIDMVKAAEEVANEDNYVLQNKKSLRKEKSALDANGTLHWYKIHKVPILTSENDIKGLVTIAKNIDFEKHVERQRNLFLATLTHDLKNPLQAQISSLEMLYKDFQGKMNAQQDEIFGLIIESSKYMRKMLSSLLKVSKESNGIIRLAPTDFNFENLIRKMAKSIRDLGEAKNVKIVLNFGASEQENVINADEIQLRRVVGNMLNNGINYAFENSVLEISLIKNKNTFSLTFKNQSDEIDDELKAQIFDKYVCGHQLTENNGVGLGLYFCKKIVEAHNGKISLDANGTTNTFKIELPISTENPAMIKEVIL